MKKILIILIVMFISYFEMNAQINLEHTFITNNIYIFPFSTETQTMYSYYDNNIIYFYNENYSLYKSVNVPIQNGYVLIVGYYPTTVLFNSDNLIEFIASYQKDDYTNFISIIYNENGIALKTFDNSFTMYVYSTKNSGYRMNVTKYTDYPDEFVTEVYSLPGTLTAINEFDKSYLASNPFPNPAKEGVYLPYKLNESETTEMYIFDSNGEFIESYMIGGHFNKIRLNTSTYIPGIYIYKYKNESNKFIVQ